MRELVTAEASPEVRTAMVFSVRRAPAVDALPVLAAGLADGDGEVSAEAARSAAAHAEGARLATALTTALASGDPSTRADKRRNEKLAWILTSIPVIYLCLELAIVGVWTFV